MSDTDSTREIAVSGVESARGTGADPADTSDAWSFGIQRRVFVPAARAITPDGMAPRPAGNTVEADTDGQRPGPDLSALKPVMVSNLYFGKRAFAPTYHWEGVVERVTDAGFRGRLTPVENGAPQDAQVEYADFDYSELSDPEERELVSIGAVFYWTIGKSRNVAGTFNQSISGPVPAPPSGIRAGGVTC